MQRPRPVLTAAGVTGFVMSVAGVLTFLGYAAPAADLSTRAQAIGSVVIGILTLGAHLLAGFHAQAKVTPNSDPRDHDGTPLKRVEPEPTPVVAARRVIDVEPLD